jgi:hypothetical protein
MSPVIREGGLSLQEAPAARKPAPHKAPAAPPAELLTRNRLIAEYLASGNRPEELARAAFGKEAEVRSIRLVSNGPIPQEGRFSLRLDCRRLTPTVLRDQWRERHECDVLAPELRRRLQVAEAWQPDAAAALARGHLNSLNHNSIASQRAILAEEEEKWHQGARAQMLAADPPKAIWDAERDCWVSSDGHDLKGFKGEAYLRIALSRKDQFDIAQSLVDTYSSAPTIIISDTEYLRDVTDRLDEAKVICLSLGRRFEEFAKQRLGDVVRKPEV